MLRPRTNGSARGVELWALHLPDAKPKADSKAKSHDNSLSRFSEVNNLVKKPILKNKLWLDRRVRIRWLNQVKAAKLSHRSISNNTLKLASIIITVPRVLVGEKLEQRQQILDTISQIENRLRSGKYRVKLDFSRVEKIFPGGMLILLAALQRLTQSYPIRISARCPPQSLSSQLLNHFGLASALGLNPKTSRPKAKSVVDWSFLEGRLASGAEVKELLDKYRNNTNSEIPETLFAALTEGLTNVRQHAYGANSPVVASFQKWWLFARYVEPNGSSKGHLYIAIYDLGVGIPATMRQKLEKKEIVIDVLDKAAEITNLSDGSGLDKRLLYAAVEHRRSQTGQPHRGNGLPEMREFAHTTSGGRLYIVSGQAQYSLVNGKSAGHTDGFKQKFPGTLLLWSLPLNAKAMP